ncbi:acyltransferase [Acetivibrio thermocellus]|uniref:acyltransferase n=1 Tax=Acetivibrio thermocellus TaxID=1515 RepID=UPI0001C14664|nr:acyltransferase [Acetivibrio thermocellus]NLU25579.1 acyltransferase [Acetivibrio thermocellus]THJ78019.1 acyltransferase [Acetivibrio thermocellus]UWV47803.1 acyltransferase [Acetivibrio thermocellus]
MNPIVRFMINIFFKGKGDSDSYIKHLRKIGVEVGENVVIYSPYKCNIDEQNPHMLKIGNNVKILSGVTILTHDFSWCVTSGLDGIISGAVGKVEIGNNVFIGRNAIIMRNTVIGDNVIIGAGSVVTKDCESNYVYAGVPAKKIMTIEEFHEKRKNLQLQEAKEVAIQYYKRTGKIPSKEILREYIFLFENRENIKDPVVDKVLRDSGHYDLCKKAFENTKPMFNGFLDFLEYCNLKN